MSAVTVVLLLVVYGLLAVVFVVCSANGELQDELDAIDDDYQEIIDTIRGELDAVYEQKRTYHRALVDIEAMATDNMANIGQRMVRVATTALN